MKPILKLLTMAMLTVLAATSAIAQLSDAEVAAKKKQLMQGINARTAQERKQDKAVMARYADAIVIDALIPGTPEGYVGGPIADYEAMLARSKDFGFDAVSYTAAIDDTGFR